MRFAWVAAVAAVAGLTLAGCVSRANTAEPGAVDTHSSVATSDVSSGGECGYQRNESDKGPFVGMPSEDEDLDAGDLLLSTSAGDLTIELDAEKAPCTVRSIAFLAGKGYYDGTSCHRLTASAGLKVLQCGDPLGTGYGGPGYTIPDELPTDLPAGPTDPAMGETVIYGRGIVAMANAGPDTGGSQFFLVYGDSTLPPAYTVFGTLTASGLAVLDQIAAGGISPGGYGPDDGAPAIPVKIEKAQVN